MTETINYNPDVLSCLANLSNDEVFTPPDLVNQMLDCLPKELFENKTTTFLDPVTKSGVFLREIAKRLNINLTKEIPDQQQRLNHIFKNQLYGIAITELTSLLARRSVYCSKKANSEYSIVDNLENESGHILYERIEHSWKGQNCEFCGASQQNYSRSGDLETHAYQFIHCKNPEEIFNMKFDVIIGNPPYQMSDGGAQASAIPIYHKFVLQAKKLMPSYLIMITPSRWFAGGRGLDNFRKEMCNDRRIRIIHDFINARECFPGVEIKGGVSYFLWDKLYDGDCEINTHENGNISKKIRPLLEEGIDTFIRYNDSIPIVYKVKSKENFDSLVSTQRPFGLRTFFKGTSISSKNSIKVYRNGGVGFISKDEIETNINWIDKHKILVPRAIGSGDSKTDNIKPIYSEPGSCCSETYLVIGPFTSKEEVENVISYIESKFFHFMVTLKKNTMMAAKTVYELVPIQNFNELWSDEKLYKKYNLSRDEIDLIDSMIKPIEINNE